MIIGRFEDSGEISKLIELDDVTLAVLIIRGFEVIIHTEKKRSPEDIMTMKQKMLDYLHKFISVVKK